MNMQQRSEETQAQIIKSAIKLFAANGYTAASVDMICKDAGISKGAFYHHFPSKQTVFVAMVDDRAFRRRSGWEGLS